MAAAVTIRDFAEPDADAVVALFAAYMRETYRQPSAVDVGILLRDGRGRHFRLVIAADRSDGPIGFAAWRLDYDLHHAVVGADIPDLYVAPAWRGRGVALRLAAGVARAAGLHGAHFIKGEIAGGDSRRLRAARRLAVGWPGESVYVSGRAFRQLAQLAELDARELIARLPAPAHSLES